MSNFDTVSDEQVRLSLALVQTVVKLGGGVDDVKRAVLVAAGARLATFTDKLGPVTVLVDRVHAAGPHWEGGTRIVFTDEPAGSRFIIVDEEPHKVFGRLRENGWKY